MFRPRLNAFMRNCGRTNSCLAVVLVLVAGNFAANIETIAEGLTVESNSQSARLVNIVLDENTNSDQRRNAMQQIGSLPGPERIDAWKMIVSNGRADYSLSAATGLIMAGAGESAESIWSAFSKWTQSERTTVLLKIKFAPNSREFLSLPRQALKDLIAREVKLDPTQSAKTGAAEDVAGVSAQLLKASQDLNDLALVVESACVAPTSMFVWYAIAAQQRAGDETSAIALGVMNNSALPVRVRVAAAVVVGKADDRGNEFVSRTLSDYIARYSDKTREKLMKPEIPGKLISAEYCAFQQDLVMLYSAFLVPSKYVEGAVFDAINGQNEPLSNVGMLVAIRRWPARIITLVNNGSVPDREALISAAIIEYHPTLSGALDTTLIADAVNERLRRFREKGFWSSFRVPDAAVFALLDSTMAKQAQE